MVELSNFGLTGAIDYHMNFRDDWTWSLKELSDIVDQYYFTTSEENTILHLACICDNELQVRFCTEVVHIDPNHFNVLVKNALHLAVQAGGISTVRYLIEENFSEMSIVQDGMYSPLHLAALYGHLELD